MWKYRTWRSARPLRPMRKRKTRSKYTYFVKKLEILDLQTQVRTLADKLNLAKTDLLRQEEARAGVETQIADLTEQSDDLLRRIASTGYRDLKQQAESLNELLERLGKKR